MKAKTSLQRAAVSENDSENETNNRKRKEDDEKSDQEEPSNKKLALFNIPVLGGGLPPNASQYNNL